MKDTPTPFSSSSNNAMCCSEREHKAGLHSSRHYSFTAKKKNLKSGKILFQRLISSPTSSHPFQQNKLPFKTGEMQIIIPMSHATAKKSEAKKEKLKVIYLVS